MTSLQNFFYIVTPITATVSLILSVYNLVVTKKIKQRTLQISLFSEYTKRYQDIMSHLYSDMQNKYYIRLYLDLCSEEYYLYQQKCLSEDVWKMWWDGMKLMMKLQPFRVEWMTQAQYYNEDFIHFFDHEVLPQSNNANSAQ